MSVQVPKSMSPEDVLWAYRYGVLCAMRSRRIYPRNQMSAYQQAPRSLFLLANRVRRAWLERHPEVSS
jgi:hypothetical protein